MMPLLRTILFFVGWVAFTFMVGVFALPLLLSQRATWCAAYFWASTTLLWLRISCGITSEARGIEHLHGARIVASKHQSAWDTLMLWCILKNPVFVLKRELYWIPVFGWYLWRSGQIGIDRSSPKDALNRITRGMTKYGEQGRVLVVFPEGTRIPPGGFKAFRSGIGRISALLQQPVVPAALNAGLFWPKKPLIKHPGHAVIKFLPPMSAAPADSLDVWVAQLQSVILAETESLSRS
jgi:1-acyl-sn-glycerol-3-phosphate acyltransferase